jgi:hypothetical protein
MVRKIVLGLATAATIGAAVLAPTAASAKPFGPGFGGGWGWHPHHFGLGVGLIGAGIAASAASSCYVSQPVLTPFGYRYRLVNVCY